MKIPALKGVNLKSKNSISGVKFAANNLARVCGTQLVSRRALGCRQRNQKQLKKYQNLNNNSDIMRLYNEQTAEEVNTD